MQRLLASALQRYRIVAGGVCLGRPSSALPLLPARFAAHTLPRRRKMPSPDAIKAEILATPAVGKLAQLFRQSNFDLRIVGGAVRDILMERRPKDYDFATNALPHQTVELLQKAGVRVVETGLQHGTVAAVIDGEVYEITTLRLDRETFGRHASVEFTQDWVLDAERRDLTINAMSMDLDGNLYDYFHGAEDLLQERVAFVGDPDLRIKEDFLRILRFFRFHGRVCHHENFEEDQLKAIRDNAGGLQQISGERIWAETRQILAMPRGPALLEHMHVNGVLQHIHLGNVTSRHLKELERVAPFTGHPCTRIAALLDSVQDVLDLAATWHLSTAERKHMSFVVHTRPMDMTKEMAENYLVDGELALHVCEALRYHGLVEEAKLLEQWDPPSFPVTGKMLKAAGIAPGPIMGVLLHKLKDHWKATRFTVDADTLMKLIPEIQASKDSGFTPSAASKAAR